jgi:uncharacterized tellurite resistance protein B-like protein
MIDLVKKFFGRTAQTGSVEPTQDGSHDVRIAACALLLEISYIDGEFSEIERERIISMLKKDYDLADAHAVSLMEASKKELQGSVDLWQFTNLINQNYTMEEKTQIIETIWHVAFADGELDKHEDYLVHKLARLLRLTHKQLIDAKLSVKKGGGSS